jgi:uncharacterized membrane protein
MRYLTTIFLKGLGAVLPIALTLYLIYWLGRSIELLIRPILLYCIPEGIYWPGMGLLTGVLLLFGIGLLVDAWIIRRLFTLGEAVLDKIPLVKSIYGSLRDFMDYFTSLKENKSMQKVVSVRIGEARLIGFVTKEEIADAAKPTHLNNLVAVYLPMSYQIGGYTIYIPREMLEPLDMTVEDAMKTVLTAGLSKKNGDAK